MKTSFGVAALVVLAVCWVCVGGACACVCLWWWGVPLVVGVLCGAIGRMRGQMMCFDLRFRAETALCQLEIADKMVDSNSENSGS